MKVSLTANISRRKSLAGGRALRTQGSSGSRRTSNFLELPGNFLGENFLQLPSNFLRENFLELPGNFLGDKVFCCNCNWMGDFSELPSNFPGNGINYDYCRRY